MDKKRLLELAGVKLKEQERKNFPPEDPGWDSKAKETAEFIFQNMLDDLGHDLLEKSEEARMHFESYVNAFSADVHDAAEKRFRRLEVAQKRQQER